MADVNAEIGVNIDTSSALAQLKSLQREIAKFHASVAKSSEAAALAQRDLQKNFLNGVNAIQGFSAELRTVKTTAENFTDSLERNKFSMREYFRYSLASTKTFGRGFRSELDTINKVAEENVKRLQTQYIKMGRDANGAMKAIAVMPTKLNLNDYTTQTQIAAQKQAIFNQLVKQGSTNLLNFGKNTQWAGRQLMVGFTIPLIGLGSAASKTFMDMEAAAIKFRKVYGDLFTATEERDQALEDIEELGRRFTKYGIAVAETVSLAADAAAAGFQGIDLQRQVTEATRLQVLGQLDQQKALETTISLQNAFELQSKDLAEAINFLNAVENQTVVALDDITTAIPKAAPTVRELGGDVKDLAFFMAAMKEGGINASQGANALKSGLASLINPSDKAREQLSSFGIDIDRIVNKNAGNLKATVVEFALALDDLSDLNRQRAIEQLFGKFQLARLSTLFTNVIKDGNQASRVLDLAGSSTEELAELAESELGITANSAMNKFKKSAEDLKLALVPIGQLFLEIATPFLENITKILDKFNNLSAGTKRVIGILTIGLGAIAPVVLMTVGLFANFVANGIKGLMLLRNGYLRLTGQSQILSEQTNFLTVEQQQALAAAASLEQSHMRLQQVFTGEAASVRALIAEYQRMIAAQNMAATKFPGMMVPGFKPQGYAKGGEVFAVPGSGNQDTVPAMLTPGEIVIPKKQSSKYLPLIQGIIADNIPGYKRSNLKTIAQRTQNVPIYPDIAVRFQPSGENQAQLASVPGLADVLGPLAARVGEARGLGFGPEARSQYPDIIGQYTELVQAFLARVEASFNANAESISNESERLAVAWQTAGRETEQEIAAVSSQTDINVIRQALGIDPDSYGTVAANFRATRGFGGRTGRFAEGNIPTSYTDPAFRRAAGQAYEMISGEMPEGMDIGHIFDLKTRRKLDMPTTIPLESLRTEANVATGAIRELERSISQAEQELANRIEAVGRTVENAGIQIGESVIDGIAQGTQSSSPSQKAKQQGQNVVDGYEQGLLEGMDDVSMAGQKLGDAASDGIRLSDVQSDIKYTQGTLPGITGQNLNVIKAQEALSSGAVLESIDEFGNSVYSAAEETRSSTAGLSKWNNKLMGASFAISGITGVASLFGNNLGGLGDNIFKVSSAMFALQGVVQALTQTQLLNLAANRLALAKQNAAFATYGAGMASRAGIAGMVGRIGVFAKTLFGLTNPVGWIVTGLTAAAGLYVVINNRLEANRKKIDGLGDAAQLTGKKLEALESFFGKDFRRFTFESFKFADATAGQGLVSGRRQQAEALIADKTFQEKFKDTIEALRGATKAEAQIVLEGLAMQLQARGGTKEELQTFTDALIKEAGQTEIVLDFAKIDISTKEGQEELTKNIDQIMKKYNKAFTKGINDAYRRTLKLTGATIANTMGALQLQLEDGSISAGQFADQISNINQQILAMPDSQAKMNLVNAVFAAMGEQAEKAGKNVTDLNDKLLLSQALLLGVADSQSIANLSSPLFFVREAARGALTENIKKYFEQLSKGLEDLDKSNNNNNKTTGKGITIQEKLIKIYRDDIKVLEKRLKALRDVNDEIDRQNQFMKDQIDLDKQITEAKISGNYLEAAALTQQKLYNQAEFNRETQEIEIQKQIDKIEERIDQLESKGKKAKLTDIEERLVSLESKKGGKGADAKGSGTGGKGGGGDTDGKGGGGTQSKPAAKSADEARAAAEKTVKSTQGGSTGVKGTRKIPKPTGPVGLPGRYVFDVDTGKWGYKSDEDVKKTDIDIQDWVQGKKTTYAQGGKVSGPGTSTSDSIPAFLSNGEYVINAGSVNKYGVGLFEALNAQKFKDGGKVKENSGWLQKFAKSLTGMPGAEMFGTAALIRKLAGMGQKGDTLSASLLPLNFVGLGAGRGIAGGAAKGISIASGLSKTISPVKASSRIMRNVRAAALEHALSQGRSVPLMTMGGGQGGKIGASMLEEGSDMGAGFRKYWIKAFNILKEEQNPLIKDMSEQDFIKYIAGWTEDVMTRYKGSPIDEIKGPDLEKAFKPEPLMQAANRAYLQAHGLDPSQPVSMFRAVRAGTFFNDVSQEMKNNALLNEMGGYWSIDSRMAASYLRNLGSANRSMVESKDFGGLYRVDLPAEAFPTPIGTGGWIDEYANVIDPNTIAQYSPKRVGTGWAGPGKPMVGLGGPGPQRYTVLGDFYKGVPFTGAVTDEATRKALGEIKVPGYQNQKWWNDLVKGYGQNTPGVAKTPDGKRVITSTFLNKMVQDPKSLEAWLNAISQMEKILGQKLLVPKMAMGGYINMASLPKFKNGIDNVPYDMPAILHKDERVLTAEENKRYGETSSTINATFNITGGNSDEIVNKVMVKLNTLNNKNNKSNKVIS